MEFAVEEIDFFEGPPKLLPGQLEAAERFWTPRFNDSTALSPSGIWSRGSVLPAPAQVLKGVIPFSLRGASVYMIQWSSVPIVDGAFIKPSREVLL